MFWAAIQRKTKSHVIFTDKVSRKRLIWCRLWEIPAKLTNKQALIRFHGTKQFKRESPFRSASGIPRASEKPLRKGYRWKCVDVPQPGMHNILYIHPPHPFLSRSVCLLFLCERRGKRRLIKSHARVMNMDGCGRVSRRRRTRAGLFTY